MTVALKKGEEVGLFACKPDLERISVCVDLDVPHTNCDFDLSAFLLGASGKCRSSTDFIFYNNPKSPDGSVVLGEGFVGNWETGSILINLSLVPADIQKIAFCVTIFEADERGQSFGQMSYGYIRVVDEADHEEMTRYDLADEYGTETAIVFGEIYRCDSDWKFKAVGGGCSGGLESMVERFLDFEASDGSLVTPERVTGRDYFFHLGIAVVCLLGILAIAAALTIGARMLDDLLHRIFDVLVTEIRGLFE